MKNFKKLTTSLVTLMVLPNLYAGSIPQLTVSGYKSTDKLSPKEETQLASFFLMYQLALKNQKENLFGEDDLCIDYDTTENGDFKISLVVNSKSYETGVASYNYNDPKIKQKYDNLGTVFNIMNQFFKASGSEPRVTVNAFADPQKNTMDSFTQRSKGMIDAKDFNRNTQSKVNNILLAKDRGENFSKQNFFPADWSNSIIKPFHSPIGEEKLPHDEKDCPSRRSVMVDLEFNPYLNLKHKEGTFTPKFDMVTANESEEMLLSASVDALSKLNSNSVTDVLKSLPKECQTESSKEYLEKVSKQIEFLGDIFKSPVTMVEAKRKVIAAAYPDLPVKDEKIFFYLWQVLSAKQKADGNPEALAILAKHEKYLLDIIKPGNYDKKHLRNPNYFYDAATAERSGFPMALEGILARAKKSLSTGFQVGYLQQSTHATDCFSSRYFYGKKLAENMGELTTPVSNFVNDQGGIKVKFDKDNMSVDSLKDMHGYFCNQCHSGIHFDKEGNKIVTSRLSIGPDGKGKYSDSGLGYFDETGNLVALASKESPPNGESIFKTRANNKLLLESIQTHHFLETANNDNQNVFLTGANKSLRLMLIPHCKFSENGVGFDPEYVQKVAKVYNINKIPFEENIPKSNEDDCFFKPKVMTACKVSPTGTGNNEGGEKPKQMVSYFNLEKMKIEKLMLDENQKILDALVDEVGRLTIQCEKADGGNYDKLVSPQELVNSLSCNKRGIKVPTPGYNSEKDCREKTEVQTE